MNKKNIDKTKKSSIKMTFRGFRVTLPKSVSAQEDYIITIRPPKGQKVSFAAMDYASHCAVNYLGAEGFLPRRSCRVNCRLE